MIRPTTPADTAGILDVLVAAGLYPAGGTDGAGQVIAAGAAGKLGPGHVWLTCVGDGGGVVGAAYYAPERLAAGVWYVHLVAVRPDRQRQGRGGELVRRAEHAAAAAGGRLVLSEVSGLPVCDPTRAFYRHLGYAEEARIRDFYKPGDDKVVFRKAVELAAPAGGPLTST